jgi:hypothetical protein
MHTTLEIDDDVLAAAQVMAEQQDRSLGEIISDLARRSLRQPAFTGERNGIPLLVADSEAVPVTLERVNTLRNELP